MKIHIRRGPDEPAQAYALPGRIEGQLWENSSVSTAFAYIQRHLDPGLSYSLSCGRGTCNICLIRVGGEVTTACTTPVVDGMTIEPARAALQLKDMVVDLSLVRRARF
jgi:succinate dehydrogenase/fumarate reductase-like Fe-S protein